MKQKDLVQLYQQMADLTKPRCASCRVPHSCCGPEYCEMAIDYAQKKGVELKRTDHPRLPLMGPDGCTAAPHLRPLCAVHVCERHYAADLKFSRKYFALREKIDMAEFEAGRDEKITSKNNVC